MGRAKTPDLTGRRFGRLLVQSQGMEIMGGRRQSVCRCLCDCGREVRVAASHLCKADGTPPKQPTLSCGCAKTLGDLTGKKFGMLTVLRETANDKKAGRQWVCRCGCGNETVVSASALASGFVRSCGCLQAARIAALASQSKKGARAAHTPEANAKRTLTVYGEPGSEARKQRGIKLLDDLERTGVIVDHANIPMIAAESPQANNPYRGVCWNAGKRSWTAYCQVNGLRWYKSGFKTPEDAKLARDEKQREFLELTGLDGAVSNERRNKR